MKALGAAAGAVVLNGCARGFELYDQGLALPSQTAMQFPAPAGSPTASGTPPPSPTYVPSADPSTQTPFHWSTPTPAPTRDTRRLCFVLWDHQLAMYGYHPRNLYKPLPETVPLFSGARNRITPAWEDYWRGILRVCNPSMDSDHFEASWRGLVSDARAFTNDSGIESGNFALHSITCGGATHEMVTGVRETLTDGDYMRIYTLNINRPPPPMPTTDHDIDMTRHFFATTGSNVKLSNGTYAVYGFPQFENTIVPLVSQEDTDLIALPRIMLTDRLRSPYNIEPEECYVPFGCTATPPVPDTSTP